MSVTGLPRTSGTATAAADEATDGTAAIDVAAATAAARAPVAVGEPLLLGVRHHGPGSARGVLAALEAFAPAAVLVEGPPEADAVVELAGDPGMRPPVALLAHVADEPARASFWPLAHFSPEWVAIRWAVERGVPVRFVDLPAAHSLALGEEEDGDGPDTSEAPDPAADADGPDTPDITAARIDPLSVLARAAGYTDPERWWEDVFEHRIGEGGAGEGALAAFAAIGEAMGALREVHGDGGHVRDAVREAHMRLRLREARREFGDRVAVVCGAWHVPALREKTAVGADRALLKGLPRVRAELSWVPWTHRRLARRSGYGAGIASPGWYAHLFEAPDHPVERWMTRVAGLLREQDHPVSSAHVIEAVRLADTLAAMRGRPLPGLEETLDAVRAVMCEGSDVPLALIGDRLVVGDALGEVPDSAPAVPLQRDLARAQRTLRLKPEALEREVQLDLRKETDAGRSRLLHRLRLLGIPWGEPLASHGATGTFRESWRLRWEPELSVRVAEAAVWGTTVLTAASAKAETEAASATAPAELTALVERCLLAELPEALPVVMRCLADRAALDADVGHLAQALPALARAVRYGEVRGTRAQTLADVATGLAERVFVALPAACAGLDGDGAAEMRRHVDAVQQAVGLLAAPQGGGGGDVPDGAPAAEASRGGGGKAVAPPAPSTPDAIPGDGGLRGRWAATLGGLARRGGPSGGRRGGLPGLIRGRAVRLLLDDGRLAEGEAERLMRLALSPAAEPADAAAWIEGFLGGDGGGGMLLVHDERLLALVDGWLGAVGEAAFTDVLPLLRRTFAEYDAGARRAIGELVRRTPQSPGASREHAEDALAGFAPTLDPARVAAALPVVALLLGAGPDQPTPDHPTPDHPAPDPPTPNIPPQEER
ncbi:DUF5682 family protein [Streptomyces polyrhachis]|uniref:DUF5682 family protein n=1 Tax=Streptomyces polyrhachis TaxID=1282885 RepID=A0ABW2G9F1_9ACTN